MNDARPEYASLRGHTPAPPLGTLHFVWKSVSLFPFHRGRRRRLSVIFPRLTRGRDDTLGSVFQKREPWFLIRSVGRMNRTRTLLIIGVFMLSLAVLAALEFRVQDEPPSEGQMVTGSLSKDMPALPKLPSLGDSEGNKGGVLVPLDNGRCAAVRPRLICPRSRPMRKLRRVRIRPKRRLPQPIPLSRRKSPHRPRWVKLRLPIRLRKSRSSP